MTILVLTGPPGIGKTTAVMQGAKTLISGGLKVGGIISREVRTNKARSGFEFVDLMTNDTRVLASISGNGPKVGKYFVSLEGCKFAAKRLSEAIRHCDVIICDEIGPMEIKSAELVNSVKKLLDLENKVIVVVHQKLHHPLIDELKNKSKFIINTDFSNREYIYQDLVNGLTVE